MTLQDWICLALVYAVIAASLGTALFLDRRGSSIDPRKVVHMGVGAVVLLWWMFSENWIMAVFFTVPFAVIVFAAMFRGNPVSDSKMGELSNDMGHRTGLFLYVVSINILVLLFWDHWTAASVGMMAMTMGDGFGSVIGRRFGRHRILNGKSLEGSLAVFAATVLSSAFIILFYGWLTASGFYPTGDSIAVVPIWVASIIAGAVASVLEAVCPGQFDNLAIPIIVASAMVLLGL